MISMIFALFFGLLGDEPHDVVERHYVRIAHAADLPDTKRTREIPGSGGRRAGLYSEAKYGWRPGMCTIQGTGIVDTIRSRLGEPLRLERLREVRRGYVWRRRGNPHRGMLIIVDETNDAVHLKSWRERDKPRGDALSRTDQNRVYSWFASLGKAAVHAEH